MIAGIYHKGSGLGDQLMRYITVRTLAENKGFEWGMLVDGEGFKGDSFMIGDFYGKNPVAHSWPLLFKTWNEKVIRDSNGVDIRSYDPEINFVEDNTFIDGSFEDNKYWGNYLDAISRWFAVEPLEVPDDTCIVGFRGGEYYADPDLGLPYEYYWQAAHVLGSEKIKTFEVHTDDPQKAKTFFEGSFIRDISVIENKKIGHSKHTNMGLNWRSARYAKHAIIPNSAFFILPRLLKHHEDPTAVTIAPRYWARHNTKVWARPACYYPEFLYV